MDTNIITALIGGACTVIGAVSAMVVNSWMERRQIRPKLTPEQLEVVKRREALSGRWEGRIYQVEGPDGSPIEFDIDFYLTTDSTNLQGNAFFEWEYKSITLSIWGKFIDDHYLRLEFKDTDCATLRYGAMFFQISPNSRTLTGRFAGYASEREGLIYGRIELFKKGSMLKPNNQSS